MTKMEAPEKPKEPRGAEGTYIITITLHILFDSSIHSNYISLPVGESSQYATPSPILNTSTSHGTPASMLKLNHLKRKYTRDDLHHKFANFDGFEDVAFVPGNHLCQGNKTKEKVASDDLLQYEVFMSFNSEEGAIDAKERMLSREEIIHHRFLFQDDVLGFKDLQIITPFEITDNIAEAGDIIQIALSISRNSTYAAFP